MDWDTARYLNAQALMYDQALREIKAGRKESHWIWFIFPQLRALGGSEEADYYGIPGLEEAKIYLRHPVLGPRLRECAEALLRLEGRDAGAVFGGLDQRKVRSCMTLFSLASEEDNSVFLRVLDAFFDGRGDSATQAILSDRRTLEEN